MDRLIQELLDSAEEDDSDNALSVDDVRESLLAHLEIQEEEVQRFPGEFGKAHWDFLVADFDSSRSALFFLALFDRDSATLVTGRGNVEEVKDFSVTDFPQDVGALILEITSRFEVFGGPLVVDAGQLRRWLGE